MTLQLNIVFYIQLYWDIFKNSASLGFPELRRPEWVFILFRTWKKSGQPGKIRMNGNPNQNSYLFVRFDDH
jgi:hypothetical protein